MVLRFREDKIRRLETLSKGLLSVDSYLADEKKMLMEELELMREKVDRNPELTRFAMENIRLLDQIRRYGQSECRSYLVDLQCSRRFCAQWLHLESAEPQLMDVGFGCLQPTGISRRRRERCDAGGDIKFTRPASGSAGWEDSCRSRPCPSHNSSGVFRTDMAMLDWNLIRECSQSLRSRQTNSFLLLIRKRPWHQSWPRQRVRMTFYDLR